MDPKNPDDHVLDLCCGKSRCPVLTEVSEGFRVQDGENVVVLTREQAELAAAWLARRLKAQ